MHSRFFSHHTPSERSRLAPHASVMPSESGSHLPLGFADVRTDPPVEPHDRPSVPLGFAPPEPRFVTELSFRRKPHPRQAVVQASVEPPASVGGDLPVGQATWRPVAATSPTDGAVVSEAGPVDPDPELETPTPQKPSRRGITFRRHASDETDEVSETVGLTVEVEDDEVVEPVIPTEPVEERVPFYKREITFRRKRSERVAPAADDDVSTLVDDERAAYENWAGAPSHPFGFAASVEDTDAADEPEADDEPEVDDSPGPQVFALENDDLDEAEAPEVDPPTEDAPEIFAAADEPGDSETDPVADSAAPPADPEPDSGPDADNAPEEPTESASDLEASVDEDGDSELALEPVAAVEDDTAEIPVSDDALEDHASDVDDAQALRTLFPKNDPFAARDLDVDELEEHVGGSGAGDDHDVELESDTIAADGDDWADEAPVKVEREPRRSKRGRDSRSTAPRGTGPKGGRGGRRVVGLKIGASQLAAAVVSRKDGVDELVQLARTPLEAGIVSDGEVRDLDGLRTALRTFFDEHKLPRRDVRVGVASNRIGVRTIDLAGIEDGEKFDNAVRFKAHEVLPVSFSESVLDYRVVEERITEDGEAMKRVLLVVAPKDQVEPFALACTGAGIRLAGIDLEALGLLRTFVSPQPPGTRLATDTATVVVSIGHESTTLLVAGGGLCEFTRVFDWGGLALQQSIAQELDVHLPEAATILHGLSLAGPGRTGIDEDMRVRALEAVRTRLTPFARELVSSLQFYQAQQSSLGIGEIVITGGTSQLEGLADALHQMIGVSVRVGDPLHRLLLPGPVDSALEQTIGSFAVPVGLAIEDGASRGVNLLPDELRKVRRKKPSALRVALPIAAVVPLAAMGFLFLQASGDVSTQRGSLADVQAQIDALPSPTRPDIDPALAGIQQQRAAALAQVLGGRLAWDRVLGDLSRVMPGNVWLTKLTAQLPLEPVATPAAVVGLNVPAPAPTGVVIEGYTYSVPDVARLLGRLGTLPSLTNVSLSTTAQRDVGKRKAVSFTILADIDRNGGAQ